MLFLFFNFLINGHIHLTNCFEVFNINVYRMTNIAIATPMIVKMHASTPITPPTDKDRYSDEEYDLIDFFSI